MAHAKQTDALRGAAARGRSWTEHVDGGDRADQATNEGGGGEPLLIERLRHEAANLAMADASSNEAVVPGANHAMTAARIRR